MVTEQLLQTDPEKIWTTSVQPNQIFTICASDARLNRKQCVRTFCQYNIQGDKMPISLLPISNSKTIPGGYNSLALQQEWTLDDLYLIYFGLVLSINTVICIKC